MNNTPKIKFVKVGRGRLALYHRPRDADFPILRSMGCTHVITLLREDEGAGRFKANAQKNGLEWIWVPIPNGKHPEGEVHERLLQAMPVLSQLLDEGRSLLIHCSAGIHRTGAVAYALLRWRGLDRTSAIKIITAARVETAEGMLEKRMRWGDTHARPAQRQDISWLHFVKEFVHRWQTKIFRSR